MAERGKSTQRSDLRLAPVGSTDVRTGRLKSALAKDGKEAARSAAALNRELNALEAEYQGKLAQLIGRDGVRQLDDVRRKGTKRSGRQRGRLALSSLDERGVHRSQILELRLRYRRQAREILARDAAMSGSKLPHHQHCDSPVVSYVPPFGGRYWSYYGEYTSNARVPVFEHYLDTATGRVGSRIRTRVDQSDNDDRVYFEYQTGFNVWHTPQRTGPLEVRLSFEFTNAVFAGEAFDEMWVPSGITHVQFAEARMRATEAQDPNQYDDGLRFIDGVIHSTGFGEDHEWSKRVAGPFESRSYRFRTAANFSQGSPVLLQAGVRHVTRLQLDDQGVVTDANIDLRLTRIEVRSCAPDIFL